jgi:hypothetical protein
MIRSPPRLEVSFLFSGFKAINLGWERKSAVGIEGAKFLNRKKNYSNGLE